jgi:hypothetical protein
MHSKVNLLHGALSVKKSIARFDFIMIYDKILAFKNKY